MGRTPKLSGARMREFRSVEFLSRVATTIWLCCAAIAAPSLAWASPPGELYQWKSVTVGAGGFAPNIIFSRAEAGLAYLRTDMGGAYRWDDRAKCWIPLQ